MSRNKLGTIAILGQGYVGLPLAIEAVKVGWSVLGVDTSHKRIDQISNGKSPIEDVSDDLLQQALKSGFRVTASMEVLQQAEIIVICVPTPLGRDGLPDLHFLDTACASIALHARQDTLLINESTSFPGTLRNYIPGKIREFNPGLNLKYAVAPERVDPGNKEWGFSKTPRLVAGLTKSSLKQAADFYKSFCEQVVEVDQPEVAELAKLLENTFRQVNIALVNQISALADNLGIKMVEVVKAASTKPYGFMPFWPTVGVGGHCIPIDPIYLSWYARTIGINLSLIEEAHEINRNIPSSIVQKVKNLGLSSASRILLVGISYKPGVSDVRESPALELLKLLSEEFTGVEWWDPKIDEWNGTKKSKLDANFDVVILTQTPDNSDVKTAVARAGLTLDLRGRDAV